MSSATISLRTAWLYSNEANKPEEHLVYLEHVSIGDKYSASGYIVREKLGASGLRRPTERLLTQQPMRYEQAEEYWRVVVREAMDPGGYRLTGTDGYDAEQFFRRRPLPPLRDPMLAHMAQPNEYVYTPTPAEVRNPPKPYVPPPPRPLPKCTACHRSHGSDGRSLGLVGGLCSNCTPDIGAALGLPAVTPLPRRQAYSTGFPGPPDPPKRQKAKPPRAPRIKQPVPTMPLSAKRKIVLED